MKIEFHHSVPPSLQESIKPAVERVLFLLPGWCERITVYFEHENDHETVATCSPMPEYRSMGITLRSMFFDETDGGENVLIHEVAHALLRPLINRFHRILEKFIQDETVRDYLIAELAEAEEGVCEDLAVFASKLHR